MTDLEWMYLILVCFYVAECGYWVRPGSLVFVAEFGGRCRLLSAHTGAWLRNDHGGFVRGNLLPWGRSLLGQQWPLVLAPDGVASVMAQIITPDGRADQAEKYLAWTDIRKVTTEAREIHINGQLFAQAATPTLARHLAALLTRLQALPEAERGPGIIAALRTAVDAGAFAEKLRSRSRQSRGALLICTVLFLYIFIASPLLLAYRIVPDLLGLLPAYFALVGLTVLAQRWGVRADDPPLRSSVWMMLVSPADAMHARDRSFRELASAWHPLAVASVVCRRERFQEFARTVLLDLLHPLPGPAAREPNAAAAEQWFRPRLTEALLGLLRQVGVDPDALVQPPLPERDECRTYCPRCRGQYVVEDGACSPCGWPLRRFTDDPGPAPWLIAPLPPEEVEIRPAFDAKPVVQPVATTSHRQKRKRKRK